MRRNNLAVIKRKPMPRRYQRTDVSNCFTSDDEFNKLYPVSLAALSQRHWTPLSVAREAIQFLDAGENSRVLDIGSGAGKFCLAAAHFAPDALLFGVEQRHRLLHQAEKLKNTLALDNVFFIHANFTQLDFRDYDHFYFYNAFYENLDGTDKIDDSIDYSAELFHYYNRFLYRLLDQKPPGTRLVTYHSLEDEIPANYHLIESKKNELLKFWIKA